MSAVLDDMDSRSGSATSLLRTVVGLYLRGLAGGIPIAGLIELMQQLGISASTTRTAVARLKSKELLRATPAGTPAGYEVNPAAEPMLARGDRRIFEPRAMGTDDAWCLISFSIPETQREARHQLRRRLHWIGCGTVAPALWICPDFLRDEVVEILSDLGLRDCATLFRAGPLDDGRAPASAVAGWWDLDALGALHRRVLGELTELTAKEPATRLEAFARYVRGVDAWRVIPYLDPGLASELLPEDWPGQESARAFALLTSRYRDPSAAYVAAVVSGHD